MTCWDLHSSDENVLTLWTQRSFPSEIIAERTLSRDPDLRPGIAWAGATHAVVHVFGASGQPQQDTFWSERSWHALVLGTATVAGTMCLGCGGHALADSQRACQLQGGLKLHGYCPSGVHHQHDAEARGLSSLVPHSVTPLYALWREITRFRQTPVMESSFYSTDHCSTSPTYTLKTAGWRTMTELWLTVFRHLAKYTYV